MKNFRGTLPKAVLVMVAIMVIGIPNMKVYSSVGSYNSSSLALTANDTYAQKSSPNELASRDGAFPAILAVAAGVGLAVVFAVGVIDGWNSVSAQIAYNELSVTHDANDFSKFDN
jgi:hypothetical protein